MARALMSARVLVMLDEPMAGVNPALTQSLLGHVKDLREQGMTVLFVEHDMDMVRDISDWVVVMAQGGSSPRAAARGGPTSPVIDAYLGAHHDDKTAGHAFRRTMRPAPRRTAESRRPGSGGTA
jgi:neutral amino acid transport system ATP-binding protein